MELFLIAWFVSLLLSFAYVLWHNLFYNPVSWVQKLAWILTVAYTGVVGLAAYCLSCRKKRGLSHEASTKADWKQGVNSEMHCLAGDATGIIVSAAIVYHLGYPNGIDLIIEYLSAFIVGLLIFQSLMMVRMFQGNYFLAVKKTFFVETVSMNTLMVGMIPVMVILMRLFPEGNNPWKLHFWFVMGMATIIGGLTAYPVNYWLVKKRIKHGCMTLPSKGKMEMHHHHQPQVASLSLPLQVFWVLFTFLLLFLALYLTTRVAPIELFD